MSRRWRWLVGAHRGRGAFGGTHDDAIRRGVSDVWSSSGVWSARSGRSRRSGGHGWDRRRVIEYVSSADALHAGSSEWGKGHHRNAAEHDGSASSPDDDGDDERDDAAADDGAVDATHAWNRGRYRQGCRDCGDRRELMTGRTGSMTSPTLSRVHCCSTVDIS